MNIRLKAAVFIAVIIVANLFLGSAPALAQNEGAGWLNTIGAAEGGGLIPTACTDSTQSSDCGITQVFQTIVNFTQVLLALTGSVVILMFVWGGTLMIIGGAAGSDQITKGKDAIKAAVFGLMIVLGAWLVVNFTILAITKGEVGGNATIFGKPFNQLPSESQQSTLSEEEIEAINSLPNF